MPAVGTALPGLVAGFVGVDATLDRIDAGLRHDRRASLPGIEVPTLVPRAD